MNNHIDVTTTTNFTIECLLQENGTNTMRLPSDFAGALQVRPVYLNLRQGALHEQKFAEWLFISLLIHHVNNIFASCE